MGVYCHLERSDRSHGNFEESRGFLVPLEMTKSSSPFKQKIIEVIRLVPHGKVVSYGQVAAYVGVPRAARQVGWILNQSEGKLDLPWWRVVNNKGYLSIRGTRFND